MGSLTMSRGDARTLTATVQPLDAFGNQVLGASGITGWKFWFTAKYDYSDADATAVFQKLPAAWQITTAGNATTPGIAICNLVHSDTAALPAYQVTLVYDVQAEDANGNPYTIDAGTLVVSPDVTTVV